MNTNTKRTFNQAPVFNVESHLKEINERFARLIKNLGANNKKGSTRYQFEVDFSYAINEVSKSPSYMQGKMFDKASLVVNNLINQLKVQREADVVADVVAEV